MNYNKKVIVGEHAIGLPDLPKDKSEILFIDEKDPYWNRELFLKDYRSIWFQFVPHYSKLYQDVTIEEDGVLISLNKEDSDYIVQTYEREMKRRREGVFFKNGDEIVWLSPDYYFVLAWCKTKRADKKGEYFDYREFQSRFFYLVWHVNNSAIIEGLMISKAKKTGITNLMWLYYLNKGTMTKNVNMANMNIDADKGAKTFRDHFLYAYHGLPLPLKPQIKSLSEREGKIVFGAQFTNSKKSRTIQTDASNELGTSALCVATMQNALDIDVFGDIWFDEFPKYKQDFGEIYRSNEAATNLQDTSVGKRWLTSYTPEDNSASFFAGKTLYFDSELRTVRPESKGQTKSKLICHHIPAYESWTSSFDKYGRCNEKDAMAKIQFGRDQLKGRPRELQAETRRYANTKKEAWQVGGLGSVFDNKRLGELASDIEEEERNSVNNNYVEGCLKWENEIWNIQPSRRRDGEFCKVRFVPLTDHDKENNKEGKFRMYYDIPNDHKNLALKFGRDEWNCLIPPPRFPYVLGGDPTSYAAGSEVIEGSKNAAHLFSTPDELLDSRMRRIASKVLHIRYFDRPESPDEAYEDYLKLILYTGCLISIEANQSYIPTKLMKEGLGRFMLVKDKNGIVCLWKRWMGLPNEEDKEYKFIRTSANADSKDILEAIVRVIKAYFERQAEGGKDYGSTFKCLETINQLMNVDITNTRIFDLFMSVGYGLLGIEYYVDILLSEQSEEQDPENISSVLSAFEL